MLLIIVFILIGARAVAQEKSTVAREAPIVTSVCEILQDPARWRNRVVSVRGVYEYGLRPQTACSQPFTTNGHVWPQAIDLTGADAEELATWKSTESLGLSFADFVHGERGSPPAPGKLRAATFIGVLRSRATYSITATKYGSMGNGYGHLNAFPAQLVVYEVLRGNYVARRDRVQSKENH